MQLRLGRPLIAEAAIGVGKLVARLGVKIAVKGNPQAAVVEPLRMASGAVPAAKRLDRAVGHDDAVVTREPFLRHQELVDHVLETRDAGHGGVMVDDQIGFSGTQVLIIELLGIDAARVDDIHPLQGVLLLLLRNQPF